MIAVDVFIIAFLILGSIKGFKNGFLVELASLVSIVLGIYIAIRFSFLTKSYLEKEVDWNPSVIQVAAFAITFLLVIIIVSNMAKIFTSLAKNASLGFVNNFFGALLGFIRTILVVSVLLNLAQKAHLETCFLSQQTKQNSNIYGFVKEISKEIYPAIADWFEVFQKNDSKFNANQE